MRKFVVVLSVLLLLLATVGPLVTGIVAERHYDEGIAVLSASPEASQLGLEPVQEVYDRGWFTTIGRTRVLVLEGPIMRALRRYSGAGEFADEPAIVVRNVLHHGPLTGLFRPGLARIETALFLDGVAPQLVEMPLLLETLIGLGGGTEVRWQVPDGSIHNVARGLSWQRADGRFDITNRGLLSGFEGAAGELVVALTDPALLLTMADAGLDVTLQPGAETAGLPAGDWVLRVASGSVQPTTDNSDARRAPPLLSVRDARIETRARVADGALDTTIDVDVAGLTDSLGATISLNGTIRVDGLDAAALGGLQAAAGERAARRSQLRFQLGDLPGAEDPRTAEIEAEFARRAQPALRALIATGAESTSDVRIGTPDGDITLTVSMTIPPDAVAPAADPRDAAMAAMARSSATLSLRIPAAVASNAIAASPAAKQHFDTMRGMGLVVREDGEYVMRAVYEGGLLSLNGVPMALSGSGSP